MRDPLNVLFQHAGIMARQIEVAGEVFLEVLKLIHRILKAPDIREYQDDLIKLQVVIGKGRSGNFILGAQKLLHGNKEKKSEIPTLKFKYTD